MVIQHFMFVIIFLFLNNWGETGLYGLCYLGHKECVIELLLDTRINTSIRDNEGRMVRDYALEREYPDIAKIIGILGRTSLLRIPNKVLCRDIVRMIIEEYA